jgi:hypothetical protein
MDMSAKDQAPAALTPERNPGTLNRRIYGAQSRYEVLKDKNRTSLSELEPRIVQYVALSLYQRKPAEPRADLVAVEDRQISVPAQDQTSIPGSSNQQLR